MAASQDSDNHDSGIVRTSAKKREPGREAAKNTKDTEPASPTQQPARLSATEVVEAGLRQIGELTGKVVIGVTLVKPFEHGWMVEVEAVEDRRVPSSSDLLAIYEAQLATDGALLGYRRKKRYPRGRDDKGDGPDD